MHVSDLMTRNPHACTADQRASDAARAMWDFDIGCVPIVDEHWKPIAMVTDRDICMAAHLRACSPAELCLRDLMSREILTCRASDTLATAEHTMREGQVRRLPVVDDEGKLVGVLSLNDIVMAGEQSLLAKTKQRLFNDLGATLTAVCRHRPVAPGVQF